MIGENLRRCHTSRTFRRHIFCFPWVLLSVLPPESRGHGILSADKPLIKPGAAMWNFSWLLNAVRMEETKINYDVTSHYRCFFTSSWSKCEFSSIGLRLGCLLSVLLSNHEPSTRAGTRRLLVNAEKMSWRYSEEPKRRWWVNSH